MKVFVPERLGLGVRVRATGSYLPAQVLTNTDVVARGAPLGVDEIATLSGIRERRRAAPDEATSDLAVAAARVALARAGLPLERLERLVVATTSPDHPVPSTACLVQHALGLGTVPACDVSAACSGFVYALDIAARAVATGDEAVLVVAAEIRSRFVSPTDRATAALFGDGAGAAIVERGAPGEGLLAIGLVADGSGAKSVHIPAGGSREPASAESVAAGRHTLVMQDGPQVYFSAVEGMIGTGKRVLEALGLGWNDVALVVPHQPNARLLLRLARVAGLPPEKLFMNVERYGNTSGAACAIALDEALRAAALKPGDLLLLLTAGAGYTGGAALLRVDEALLAAARGGAQRGGS